MKSPFKDLPREVSALTAASFFVAVGFGIVLPAIPVFARTFGVNNAAIGLIISMFAITRFASDRKSTRLNSSLHSLPTRRSSDLVRHEDAPEI